MPRNRKQWPYEFRCGSCGAEYTRPEAQRKKHKTKVHTPAHREVREKQRGMGRSAWRVGEPLNFTVDVPAETITTLNGYACWDCGTLLTQFPLSEDNVVIEKSSFVVHPNYGPGIVTEIRYSETLITQSPYGSSHVLREREEPILWVQFRTNLREPTRFKFSDTDLLRVVSEDEYEELDFHIFARSRHKKDIATGKLLENAPMTFGLKAGMTVEHPDFGEGVVIEFVGSGDRTQIVIDFSDDGIKNLRVLWTLLSRIRFRIGDNAVHEVFGEGVIIDLIGSYPKTKVVIDFRDHGRETLLLRTAPLQKVPADKALPDVQFVTVDPDVQFITAECSPPQPTNSQELGLRVGDKVEHPVFGEGIISDITGLGEKTEAVINFREKGPKHLLLAWSPLKKI